MQSLCDSLRMLWSLCQRTSYGSRGRMNKAHWGSHYLMFFLYLFIFMVSITTGLDNEKISRNFDLRFKSRLVPSRCPWKRTYERPLETIRSERRTKSWKTRVNTTITVANISPQLILINWRLSSPSIDTSRSFGDQYRFSLMMPLIGESLGCNFILLKSAVLIRPR